MWKLFSEVFGRCFFRCVADYVRGEEGQCETVENGEKEEAYASAKRGSNRAMKDECECLKYNARQRKAYLGIQDENQIMSKPMAV